MSQTILPASHLLSYGMLLGTAVYQTFVMTKVAYLALPTSAFTMLQKRVFPVYFRMQSLLIVATALTYPPTSVLALAQVPLDAGLLAFAGATALANLAKYGPATTAAMIARTHQETRDGKKHDDPSGVSEEMRLKKRAFSRNHAMSIHLNLLSVIATVVYGVRQAQVLNRVESSGVAVDLGLSAQLYIEGGLGRKKSKLDGRKINGRGPFTPDRPVGDGGLSNISRFINHNNRPCALHTR